MPAHSIAIANEFLKIGAKNNYLLTQMQLQKLVYIANGFNLAIYDRPLTSDPVYAWDYGPIYYELRIALRGCGTSPIKHLIKTKDTIWDGFDLAINNDIITDDFSANDMSMIRRVFDVYGKFQAYQLSALTHDQGTPWRKVFYEECRPKGEIPNYIIKNYFLNIINAT